MRHRSVLLAGGTADQRSGYSLLELLLVLVVIGMLATLLVPSLRTPMAQSRVEQAAKEWSAKLRDARLRAMETGLPHAVSYTPNTDQYLVSFVRLADHGSSRDRYEHRALRLAASSRGRELRFLPAATPGNESQPSLADVHTEASGFDQLQRKIGNAAVPIFFGGDGAANRDRTVWIRDTTSNRVARISVQALTGSITVATSP